MKAKLTREALWDKTVKVLNAFYEQVDERDLRSLLRQCIDALARKTEERCALRIDGLIDDFITTGSVKHSDKKTRAIARKELKELRKAFRGAP